MKKLLKVILSSAFVITACNTNNSDINNLELVELKKSNVDNKLYTAKVSDNGANIFFNINFPKSEENNFSTKDNSSGVSAKTVTDIATYQVYLIKNNSTTGYPAGGDPIGDMITGGGPFDIANTGTPGTKTVRFAGVPATGTGAYYVAVRAKDSGSNDLIIDNNGSGTAWTGDTATTTLKVAVSTGNGITVSSALAVSSTTPLPVSPQLIGATGATIEAAITPNGGSNSTTISATGL